LHVEVTLGWVGIVEDVDSVQLIANSLQIDKCVTYRPWCIIHRTYFESRLGIVVPPPDALVGHASSPRSANSNGSTVWVVLRRSVNSDPAIRLAHNASNAASPGG
jgi:hypothetical protein